LEDRYVNTETTTKTPILQVQKRAEKIEKLREEAKEAKTSG